MKRRNFIKAASGLFLAPAIVKAENIMRVKPIVMPDWEVENGLYTPSAKGCGVITKYIDVTIPSGDGTTFNSFSEFQAWVDTQDLSNRDVRLEMQGPYAFEAGESWSPQGMRSIAIL